MDRSPTTLRVDKSALDWAHLCQALVLLNADQNVNGVDEPRNVSALVYRGVPEIKRK